MELRAIAQKHKILFPKRVAMWLWAFPIYLPGNFVRIKTKRRRQNCYEFLNI